MNKQPLQWHRDCARNMQGSLERYRRQEDASRRDADRLEDDLRHLRHQIQEAELRGKDSFDPERFLKTETKAIPGWTPDWPTAEGMYWFFGWQWKALDGQGDPRLLVARVSGPDSKGNAMYSIRGGMWFPQEAGRGLFKRIREPELPDKSVLDKLPSP